MGREPLTSETNIIVDLVAIDEVTAAPAVSEESKTEVESAREPEPETELPEVGLEPEPDQVDPNEATSALDQIAALPRSPKVPVPPRKPPPPKKDLFADLVSLVKNLEEQVASRSFPNADQGTNVEESDRTVGQSNLETADRATLSELDNIRAHVERCWRIDPGKEGLQELNVDIRVFINPDGSVQRAVIEDTVTYFSDPLFRTFANSARTAILSCKAIPISPQRYNIFKEIVFSFSPQGRIN